MSSADTPRRAFRRRADSSSDAYREVDEELEIHLDWATEELIAEGWPAATAREEARRRFGDLEETRSYCAKQSNRARTREDWTMGWDSFMQDLRFAVRTLKKAPTYSLVVIATLAIGIAANTTVFSLMNPYLFRPLPFGDAESLVQLGGIQLAEDWDGGRFSVAQIEEFEARSQALDAIGGYYYGTVNLTGTDRAERLQASWFAGPMFQILDAPPIIGRTFGPQDVLDGTSDVVVLGEPLWERRYARDPGILGQTIELDGVPKTVIGVMPEQFTFPFGGLHLWLPMPDGPDRTTRSEMYLIPVARMATGSTPEAVKAEMDNWLAGNAGTYPELDGRYDGGSVKGLREALNFVWEILPIAFGLLLGAVSFVLIIACVNVASLTLARAGARNREVAVRAAIGADRGRLVRQLVTESFVLALLGGTLGILLATVVMGTINGVIPPDLFRVGDVTLDSRVLAFSAAITLVTPFLFGMLPALNVARAPLAGMLKEGSRSGGSRSSLKARRMLVVAEVTLAIVLVTGTGLMIRSLGAVTAVDLGFDDSAVLAVELSPPSASYPGTEEINAFWREIEESITALPAVESAGVTSHPPLNHETIPLRYASVETGVGERAQWPGAYTSRVDDTYFGAMGIGLREGRVFTSEDDPASGSVVISSEMADRLWPAGDGVGQTILYGSAAGAGEPLRGTVVGIVDEIRYESLDGAERPHIYRPLDGSTSRRRFVTARIRGEPTEAIASVREVVQGVDSDVPATIRPLSDIVMESTLLWSVSSLFLGVFGIVALGLAALGIYGLIAYSVQQRQKEMGLRLALGADASDLQKRIVGEGLKLTGIGVGVGLVLALAGGQVLQGVLYGVQAADPVTLGATLALFTAVAFFAALIPARTAARTNPLEVLREE